MVEDATRILRSRAGEAGFAKLMKVGNQSVHEFLAKYVRLCNPDSVFICSDTPEDFDYIRESAIRKGEEQRLALPGHSIHFDGYFDQGRDRKNTGILVPKGVSLGEGIETKERETALKDIHEILGDIMRGREMYVCFFCLGPTGSEFSIPCVQVTDSSYVAHNEMILYRPGYEEFVRRGSDARFFRFVHTQGELDERRTSKNLDKRRIYIDLEEDTVYSANTQYGGNTIGLKKLAMRLAIDRGSKEGWLCEHMLILGVHGPGGRVTYLTGAFPSLCGKTSTTMLEGESIVGDDIAYLHRKNGEVRAVNVERGMFGIIEGVNSKDDRTLYKVLNSPGEIIFSNVLVTPDRGVHWIGKNGEVPPEGENHSGEWRIGKKDRSGKEIPCSHPNARFTVGLGMFPNLDPHWDDPEGVVVSAIVYGGRDSDTLVPVEESFDWVHGIVTKGASLESEATAAVIGNEGAREFNPMSNLDFLSTTIGRYVQANLDFAKGLTRPPKIFSVNYFLRDRDGRFLNEKSDKRVWYKWMESRVHGDVEAVDAPTGRIPGYEDLRRLFQDLLTREYREEDYVRQFTVRVPENLSKVSRVEAIFRTKVPDTPQVVFEVLEAQRRRLLECREIYGDYIPPTKLHM